MAKNLKLTYPKKKVSDKLYVLKSKNIPLIDICLEKWVTYIDNVPYKSYRYVPQEIYTQNIHLLPKEIDGTLSMEDIEAAFMVWLRRRRANRRRRNVEIFANCAGDSDNIYCFLDVGYGMSLNDTYWIVPKDEDLKWEDWSPYTNPLDKEISRIAFQPIWERDSVERKTRITAEPTTAGALRKCWINKDDGIYMLKAKDDNAAPGNRSVINMEYYAAQVAETMGLKHVPYKVYQYKHNTGQVETVCECPIFTSEDIGFVPAISVIEAAKVGWDKDLLDRHSEHKKFAKLFGEDFYADMMVFDAVILNSDRHLGNFGLLIDNNTGEYLGPAPLFDNGSSWMALEGNIDNIRPNRKGLWLESGAYFICDVAAYYPIAA